MPKKKLVTEYRWHRVPQYQRERSQEGQLEAALQEPEETETFRQNISQQFKNDSVNADDEEATAKLQPWTFGIQEKVEQEVTDLVVNTKAEVARRRSTWVLVDDGDDDSDQDQAVDIQEVAIVCGEIPIEAVILPKDRTRLDLNLFWKDENTFLKEVQIFLHIQLRNWYALHGDSCRVWRIPTTVHSWWGEWGTFLGFYNNPEYWISRYPSHIPGRYAWDFAISSHKLLEKYYNMRRIHKAPRFLSWTCEGIDAREEMRNIMWNYYGLDCTPSKFDFQVQVQVQPGDKRISAQSALCNILTQPGYLEMWKALSFYLMWRNRIPIHYHRDNPSLGGAYADMLELSFVALHNKFPELKEILYDNVVPLEWQVYRQCIEDSNIDPELDIVHTYTNYDVRGGKGVAEYYDGQQYVISDKFQEDYDYQSGDWWYFPRNYRYEMQRGLGHASDNWTRTRAPLYERMLELSSVGYASDPKTPWRKGSFQNLGWFLDQFLFHFLPYLRRTKVALDLVTRPFSYKETSLSRLDGTLWLISRACRILTKKKDFSNDSKSWAEFKRLVDTEGKELEDGMSSLLDSIDPILNVFHRVRSRLGWASTNLELSQSHWRLIVGRSYYLLGCFRFNLLHGMFYNQHFKDRYYGVPGLYSSSRHKRQLDPYNEISLEQFPLRTQKKSEELPNPKHIPGSETPPKPSFVPWDDEESVQRVPWNFYWMGSDAKCHVHLPLENRCVPLECLGSQNKSRIYSCLFKNAVDIVKLAKEQLKQADASIYKYTDKKDIVFMSPTGPVGPRDIGYQNLLNLLQNPHRVNPQDTTPLEPFDSLLNQWWDVVGKAAAAERKFRHMLGPGAYRLSQSLEQIYDLYQEVHLMLPHIIRMKSMLKTNLNLVRGLGSAENSVEVLKFIVGHRIGKHFDLFSPILSSLLRVKNQPFYVVRFSMSPEDNALLGKVIPTEIEDSLESVEKTLEQFYYIKNRHYEGYVKASKERRGNIKGRLRMKMDRHRGRTLLLTLRGNHEREDYYRNRLESNYNTVMGASGVRRFSSANLFYLEDDRPKHFAHYKIGNSYRPKDKLQL